MTSWLVTTDYKASEQFVKFHLIWISYGVLWTSWMKNVFAKSETESFNVKQRWIWIRFRFIFIWLTVFDTMHICICCSLLIHHTCQLSLHMFGIHSIDLYVCRSSNKLNIPNLQEFLANIQSDQHHISEQIKFEKNFLRLPLCVIPWICTYILRRIRNNAITTNPHPNLMKEMKWTTRKWLE